MTAAIAAYRVGDGPSFKALSRTLRRGNDENVRRFAALAESAGAVTYPRRTTR